MKILAMDLGKSKSVVCVYDVESRGHRFLTIRTEPEAVHDLVVAQEPDRVVIEVCSIAGWVYDLVTSLGFKVEVANSNGQAWQWKHVKRKTDRDDALKLAKLSVMDQLLTVHMPSGRIREKRRLINYRSSLVSRHTAVKNRIREILNRQGLTMASGKQGWTKKSVQGLREMAAPFSVGSVGSFWRSELWLDLQQYEGLAEAIAVVEEALDGLNEQDEQVRLLRTVPGVGVRLAETVAAYLDEPHRFANGKQVGCYAGLTPRQFQSGSMDRQGRISGQGNTLLRSMLVEVCWLGLQWNPWLRQTYERVCRGSASRKKIAITAVARKLLVRLWAMLRDGVPWRASKLAAAE